MLNESLQGVVLESIAQYARVETKVESLESAINHLRTENEKILSKISESLERLAAIQEKLATNSSEHTVIHKRIDAGEKELEAYNTRIHERISNVDKSIKAKLAEAEVEFGNRVEAIEKSIVEIHKNCHSASHVETNRRLTAVENKLSALKVFSTKIRGVPIWVIMTAMILLGFGIDFYNYHSSFAAWMGFK